MISDKKLIKEEIVRKICAFETTIKVRHYQANKIFEECLIENPQLLLYIKSYIGGVRFLSFEPCAVFKLTYMNNDIPKDRVICVKNDEEVENELHKGISNHFEIVALYLPNTLNINKIYNDFIVGYGGFYSNLTDGSFEVKAFPKFNYIFAIFRFKYRIGRIKLNMMERMVDQEIERLSGKLFLPEMSSETKAYIAHNYLAKTIEYWLKKDANPLEKSYMQSAYGALINHRCVCQGYAEAYKRLLDSQNIICDVICGKIKGSSEHHAWNVISFDAKNYFHVDVTWDARKMGEPSWDYFCKTDRYIQGTRLWERKSEVCCNMDVDIKSIAKKEIEAKKLTFIAKGIDAKYL